MRQRANNKVEISCARIIAFAIVSAILSVVVIRDEERKGWHQKLSFLWLSRRERTLEKKAWL